jgi:PIN domain nuclease of toxin-antitoxin system
MSRIVLDASAILALVHREPGHEKLTLALLDGALCSSVNLAEVQAKLVSRGWGSDEAWEDATSAIDEVTPFDASQAKICGDLITVTRPLGLSLGDRACLALGITYNAPIYTTEKSWKKLRLGVRIQVIR